MLPQGGDAHLAVHVGGGQAAEDMALPVAAHGLGPIVQALPLAAEHGLYGGAAPQGSQQGVIPVEHQQSVFLNVGQQLALGLEDVLPAAQPLDVGIADVGDDPNVGPDDVGQIVDLAGAVHAHLQHTHLHGAVQAQDGQGQADVVVKVPLGLQHPEPGAQHGGDHVLGRGLAHAAGDGHKWDVEPGLIPGGQVPQGPLGVGHLHIELILPIALPLPGGETAHCAALQGGVDIGVAVEPVPHQGDEQGAGVHVPAVRVHLLHDGGGILKGAQQSSVHGLKQLAQSDLFHGCYSPFFLASRDFWMTTSHSWP